MANLDLGLANQIDRIYEYMSEQFYSISTMRKGNKARFTFSYSFYWNWLTETQFLPLLENQISRIVNWPKCSSSRWNSSRWLFTAKGRLRFSNLSSRNRTDGDHSSIRLRKSMKKKVERERTKASSRTSSIRAHCLILLFLSRSLDNSIFSSSIFFSCQSQFHNWSLEHCRRERERERERERLLTWWWWSAVEFGSDLSEESRNAALAHRIATFDFRASSFFSISAFSGDPSSILISLSLFMWSLFLNFMISDSVKRAREKCGFWTLS